jgi:outer membrane lipoprotein-sorting protein
MNRLLTIFFFVLITSQSVVSAQTTFEPMKDIDSFIARLARMSDTTNTISCDFIQEKYLIVLSQKIVSRGQFWFKKENQIRWEYNSPYKYLIIINKDRLLTGDEKNRNKYDLNSNKMLQTLNGFITGCIQGDILKNKNDYNVEYSENTSQYLVKLTPRSEKVKQMLHEVQIWFDKKDLTVSRLKMVESGDDYTKIDFINKKLNTEIPLEKFIIN